VSFTGSTLCTHFGLSGPAVLDVSRFYLEAKLEDAKTRLTASWLPSTTREELERELTSLGGRTPLTFLRARLPERLAKTLVELAGVDGALPGHRLTREARKALLAVVLEHDLDVVGDRGFGVAEVTAGGVPLAELRLDTMESRVRPG